MAQNNNGKNKADESANKPNDYASDQVKVHRSPFYDNPAPSNADSSVRDRIESARSLRASQDMFGETSDKNKMFITRQDNYPTDIYGNRSLAGFSQNGNGRKPRKNDYGDHYNHHSNTRKKQKKHQGKPPANGKSNPRKGGGSCLLRLLAWILLLIILAAVIFGILVLNRIHYTDENPDTQSITSETGELKSTNDVQNILLFGVDNHSDDEYGRSDTMILLSINTKNRKLRMTSFMRDLYLYIPGYGYDKLNAAFAHGGAALAAETIMYNFRIEISSYAIVDFAGFTDIIDNMGGIDLQLTADEIEYINWQSHRNKQTADPHELNVNAYTFTENADGESVATVHLNGRQALWYARDRDSAGSDFDRTARQRILMDTMFASLKSGSPTVLFGALWGGSDAVTTNIKKDRILSLGFGMVGYLGYEREEYRVPRSDNYYDAWEDGAQVLEIDDMDYEREKLYGFVFGE